MNTTKRDSMLQSVKKNLEVSVAKREARASAGDLRSDEVVLRSATFSSRLVVAALG